MRPERVRSEFREFWIELNSNIVFRVYFFPFSLWGICFNWRSSIWYIFAWYVERFRERKRNIVSYYDINLLYSRMHLKWISLCYCAKSWRQNTFRVFHWKCSTPLYSRSASLIGSAYLFLYISFCFWFNKVLTNLTSLHQHLQYNRISVKLLRTD